MKSNPPPEQQTVMPGAVLQDHVAVDKEMLQQTVMDSYDVRELLRISRGTLYNWCKAGKLAFSKVGSKLYFDAADINMMLKKARKQGI